MPLPEYTTLPNVSFDFPIGEKVYRAFGPSIGDHERLVELFTVPTELAKVSKLDLAKMALGQVLFDEMVADDVPYAHFERAVLAVTAWSLYNREIGEVTWNTGVPGPAIVEHMKSRATAVAPVTDEAKPATPRTRRKAG